MSKKKNTWGGAPQQSDTPGGQRWGGAPQQSDTPGAQGWGGAPQQSDTPGGQRWGGAPQQSDTPGAQGWGGAPQQSDTPGGQRWGGAPQQSDTPGAQGNAGRTFLADTPEYNIYVINGMTYRTKRVISTQSGEAKIFQVENGGADYCLKLYRPGVKPNHDVLDKVMGLRGNGLLVDIYAHGVWHDDVSGADLDYEIMQYLPGGSMATLKLTGDERRMKEIAAGMASALDYAHKHGILHRDVKPANFMFTDDSRKRFVLTDWGLAKLLDSDGRTVTDAGRTKIYAAPEMYTYIPGTPTYIGAKADFFSMGMALLALWKGEGNLIADERRLVHDKQEETLPYPAKGEMSEHLLSLIKALTRRNPDKRAGFADIARWAKGEIIYKDPKSDAIGDFRIVFSASDNLIAHNCKELADMMERHPELAKKYLYTDSLTKRFREIDRPEIAVELNEITEIRYPGNRDAGLYAAILLLDPGKPFKRIKGGECRDQKEIARDIFEHQTEYSAAASDPGHRLWVYLEASGLGDMIKGKAQKIKKEGNPAMREIAYSLDPSLPFCFVADKKRFLFNTLDDYAEWFRKKGDLYTGCQIRDDFLMWVASRDKVLGGKAVKAARESGSERYRCMLVHYTILPDRDLEHAPVKGSEIATTADIARRLMSEVDGTFKGGLSIENQLLTHHKESQLYAYLRSKGIYDKQLDYINFCLDINSKDNLRKCAPYTRRIAYFKIAYGLLGGIPEIHVGGRTLRSIADVRGADLNSLPQDDQDLVADWLAVSFHENPDANYAQKTYYERVKEYYDFMIENVNGCRYGDNVRKNTAYLEAASDAHTAAWRKIKILRWVMILLCFIPMLAVIAASSYLIVTEGAAALGSAIESVGWWVAVGGGVIAALCALEYGLIAAVIAYFAAAGLLKLIFWLLSGIAPWVVVALFVGVIIYFAQRVFRKNDDSICASSTGFSFDEAIDRVYIGAAFNSRSKVLPNVSAQFPADAFDASTAVARKELPSMIRNTIYMLVLSALGVWFCVWMYSDKPDAPETGTEQLLSGSFKGDVSGTPSEIVLSTSDKGEVTAEMTINYRAGATVQTMKGTSDGTFPVTLSKNDNKAVTLTIDTAGYVGDGAKALRGTYVNSKGKSKSVNYTSHELQKVQ